MLTADTPEAVAGLRKRIGAVKKRMRDLEMYEEAKAERSETGPRTGETGQTV
jgi:hypothetical protein